MLQGSVDSHKLICQRDDDYTVSVTLPGGRYCSNKITTISVYIEYHHHHINPMFHVTSILQIICSFLAHSPAEVVDVSLYRLPSDQETFDHTYHPQLLVKDQIIYTDMSHYLAELLVQSVTDGTQVGGACFLT